MTLLTLTDTADLDHRTCKLWLHQRLPSFATEIEAFGGYKLEYIELNLDVTGLVTGSEISSLHFGSELWVWRLCLLISTLCRVLENCRQKPRLCMTSSFPSPALRQDTLDLTPLTAFSCRSKDGETSHSPKGRGFRLFQSGGGNVGAGGSTAEAGTGTLTKDAIMSRVGQRWDCCYDYCCFQSVCLSDFNIPSQFHVLISYQSKLVQD